MKVLLIDHKMFCAGISIVFILLNFSLPVQANSEEDAYLRELESEAGELKDFEPTADSTTHNSDTAQAAEGVSPKEQEFSDRLKSSLPNTFLIYEKLSKSQKGLVIESYYVNEKSMAEASRQIFNIYFKKIKTN